MVFHARLYFLVCLLFLGLLATWPATAEVALEFVDTQLVTRALTRGVGTESFDSNTFDEFPGVRSLAEQRESATSDPEQKASASGQAQINCDYVVTPELITASGFVAASAAATDTIGLDEPDPGISVGSTGESSGVFEAQLVVIDAPETLTVSASITSFASPTFGSFRNGFTFRIFGNGIDVTTERSCQTGNNVNCGLPTIDEELVLQPGSYFISLFFITSIRDGSGNFVTPESCNASLTANWSWTLGPTCDDPNAKIPCVCEVGWNNPAGGNWLTQENWDQNRVPQDRGEGCDNVFFDRLGSAYTVTNPADAATANTLSVTADDVTLQDGGLILKGAPSDLAPSNALTIEDAGLLRLSNYTIATPSVLVDSNLSNPGRPVLIVDSGASLEVSGRLLLGSDFGGDLLDIRLGGTVNSGPVEIGKSGSEETLAHVAGAWNMQRLELGVLGDAKILIDNGGKVQVNSTDLGAILGSVPGVLGTIELKNLNSELAVNGPLELGLLGKGVASLESGAKLISSSCTISGDDSQLNVDGASGNVPSLAQIIGNLNVAPGSGVGSLNITNGGLVQVSGNALLGETNIAFLLLEGQDPTLGFGAQMLVDGELILGQGDGAAKVNITNGGTLSAANGLKLSAGSQVSTIVMEKGTTSADTPPNLVAGGFTDIGELGKGEIFASDGATLNFSGNTTLGQESSGFGIMELNGVSPDSSAPTKMVIEGQLDIGFHGQGLLRMNDGAQVEVGSAVFIGGLSTDTASAGALGLTNDNSALLTSFTAVEDIFIGGNDSFVDLVGPVRLRSDNRIFLERNGRIFMTQNAVLSQQNGFIQRGGRIVVGAAQGNKQVAAPATIEGDWSIEDPASIIELNAANATSLLRVTGNVSLGGTLEIRFAEGIELNTDDLLGLIQFDGAISGSFANISFPNRSSDFVGEIVTLGNTLQLRVIVPGEPVVGDGEGEGEGEPTPPTGCDGCRGDSAPIEKALGDVLSIVFGLAMLMGAHLHFRRRLVLTH